MRIKTKILICIFVVFFSFTLVSASTYFGIKTLVGNMQSLAAKDIPISTLAAELHISMLTHRRFEKDILLNIGSVDKQRDYLERLEAENKKMSDVLNTVASIITSSSSTPQEIREQIQIMDENLKVYFKGVAGVAQKLMVQPYITPQEANKQIGEFKEATYNTENAINTILEYSAENMELTLEKQNVLSGQIIALTIICSLLGVGIAFAVLIVTMRSITNPLQRVINYTEKLKNGDFEAKPQGKFVAEMQQLIEALVSMSVKINDEIQNAHIETEKAKEANSVAQVSMEKAEKSAKEADEKRESIVNAVEKLEEVVNIITSASEELVTQIEQSSRGAESSSARMTDTATAMTEMNGTVLEVARNSSISAELADNTKQKANEGADITKQCQAAMAQVKDDSLTLRQNMNELAGHANSIGTVMGVISDIADQTNLLALNAAIEAARAGEAGRGFAVVADEVRKLAEKTMISTAEVGNAIKSIQASTEINVKQVDTAVSRIEEATLLAIASGEALSGIVTMAEESADGIRAIATASEEQSATSDEIAQSISQVNTISSETSTAMFEASKAVSALAIQSSELSRIIEELKQN